MSLLSPSLEAFWTVSQSGTVLQAAKNMKLTQTGVTQRIRSLEKQLGVTLFTRSRTGMLLTREGQQLLHYVKNARDLETETLKGLGNEKQMAPPEISVCASPSLLEARVLNRLKTLAERTPSLKLKIRTASTEESVNFLKSAKVQIALVLSPPKLREIQQRKLSQAKIIFVGSNNLKRRSLTTLVDQERFIISEEMLAEAEGFLRKSKIISQPDLVTPTTAQALSLAAQGLGFTVCFEEQWRSFKDFKNISPLENRLSLELPVSLLWYPRKVMPEYFKNLLSELSRPL